MLFRMKEGVGKHHISLGKGKMRVLHPGDEIKVFSEKELGGAVDKFDRIDFKDDNSPVHVEEEIKETKDNTPPVSVGETPLVSVGGTFKEEKEDKKKSEKKENKWKRGEK